MKKGLIHVAVLLMAVGCSKDELPLDLPGRYEPSTEQISLTSSDNWGDEEEAETQTRGELIPESSDFNSFTTFAYYLPSTNGAPAVWDNRATPNFMYNQKISRTKLDDGTFEPWEYSPVKYWPANPNDRICFFACAPHNDRRGVEVSSSDKTGAPEFTVTPDHRPYYHQDFMTATPRLLGRSDDNEVKFTFKHKLAQVKIYAAHNGEAEDTVRILSVAISGLRESGKLIYNETAKAYQWEHLQSGYTEGAVATTTYTLIADDEVPNELKTEKKTGSHLNQLSSQTSNRDEYTDISLAEGQAYLLLVPQDNIAKIDLIVLFEYEEYDTGKTAQSFQQFTLSNSSLQEGKITNYLLLIDPSEVGFGAITTSVEPWDEKEIKDDSNNDWVVE